MGRDNRQEALLNLIQISEELGYVTFDNIMDCADSFSLPIQDFDWLSNTVATRGIIVYDETPTNRIKENRDAEEYDDYAHGDYDIIYDRIIELDPNLKDFVEGVRRIVPPQWREFNTLKYQAMEGNQHARERMVEMHLRVALRLALQRAEAFDLDIQETIGDACVGLVIAVDKYNPDTNGAFASYASLWILRSIQRSQPTRRPLMYYPAYKKELLFAAYPLIKKSEYTEYPDLSDAEDIKVILMEEFSLTNEQAEELLVAATPLESLEELFSVYLENNNVFEKHYLCNEADNYELFNSGEDINQYIDELSKKEQLAKVLGSLSDRERRVLEMRFGLDNGKEKTLEEIGEYFNVTRERIRQIEAKGMKKLRAPAKKRKLIEFADLCPSEIFSENDSEVE